MSRGGDSNFFVHSTTDLMTSLFVVFVLLLVAYINRSYEETRKSSFTLKDLLVGKLKDAQIQAENDPKDPLALLISIGDENLQFDRGESTIKDAGQNYLKSFVPKLAKVLTSKDVAKNVQSVVIEGHTDSDGNDESNLRLSQDRSYQVLKFALNGAGLDVHQRDFLLERVSMNGRGERDLLPYGVTPGTEDKLQSRRVELKIRVKSFEQRAANKPSAALEELTKEHTQ